MGSRGDTQIRVTRRGRELVAAHDLCPEGFRFTLDRWVRYAPGEKCSICLAPIRLAGARRLQFHRPHYWLDKHYGRGPRRNDIIHVLHICKTCWYQGA